MGGCSLVPPYPSVLYSPPDGDMNTPLSMKGIGDGLLVAVPEGTWSVVRPSLLQAIDGRSEFFRGANVALQMSDRARSAAELGGLRDELSQREIALTAILATSEQTRVAGADPGLALEVPPPNIEQDSELEPIEPDLGGGQAILVHRTLRSAHVIRHPGHVVVIGDINPGAEVVAGGNVVVWGRIRGVVHAGATGNTYAVVCALDLAPTQLRIGTQISISPERKGKPRPEMAMLKDKRFNNLYLIPAAQTRDKTAVSPEDMVRVAEELRPKHDWIVIDSPAGIERGFRNALAPADVVLIVTNPEVSAVRDADRIIGMTEAEEKDEPKLILHRVKADMVRRGEMLRAEDVIDILAIELIGVVPEDEGVLKASNQGVPIVLNGRSKAGGQPA